MDSCRSFFSSLVLLASAVAPYQTNVDCADAVVASSKKVAEMQESTRSGMTCSFQVCLSFEHRSSAKNLVELGVQPSVKSNT